MIVSRPRVISEKPKAMITHSIGRNVPYGSATAPTSSGMHAHCVMRSGIAQRVLTSSSRNKAWYSVSVDTPYSAIVSERPSSIHCGGTVMPSHWVSQPADSPAMRRFRISQPENSTYSGWRLMSAVISTNSDSTIMPPSSRPDLR
jgi:hypothetical protein